MEIGVGYSVKDRFLNLLFWWPGYKETSICMYGEQENLSKIQEESVHTRMKKGQKRDTKSVESRKE